MKKRYKNFTIEKMKEGNWWHVKDDGVTVGLVLSEEESRRVIWLKLGRGEAITDDMMDILE